MRPQRSQGGFQKTRAGLRPFPWGESLRQACDLLFFSAAFAVLFNLFFPYGIELKVPPPVDHGLMDDLKIRRASEEPPPYAGFKPAAHRPPRTAAAPTPSSGSPENFVLISLSGAKNRFDGGACVFLDARSPVEYKEGHIPGALNFDANQLDKYAPLVLPQLPDKNREIVCYCHGGDCDLAKQVAQTLQEQGYRRVEVFQGGWPEWKKAGYPARQGEKP